MYDPAKHKCVVFMDEAGLPEEEKESLKVLHYYLEGHMSTKAKVSFVGITNHVLDAAKTNRCVCLQRQLPDREEMLKITNGILFSSSIDGVTIVSLVKYGENTINRDAFSVSLCQGYTSIHDNYETFFGLRDFIYIFEIHYTEL